MFVGITVPLDCSPFAECALPVAASLAERSGSRLDLVHVHIPVKLPKYDGAMGERSMASLKRQEEDVRGRVLEYLDAVAGRLRETRGGLEVRTRVLSDGAVGPLLLREARPPETNLIVMTTHGRGPMGRAVLGGTTDVLVRNAAVPVLVVRGTAEGPDIDVRFAPERILLPLDGTLRSENAIACAVSAARPFRASLTLLRVVVPGQGVDEAEAQLYLDGVAGRLGMGGLRVDTLVLERSGIRDGVLEAAEATEADLVVLATRGQGYLARLVMGSVAEHLVRAGPTPVLVCRGPKRQAVRSPGAADLAIQTP